MKEAEKKERSAVAKNVLCRLCENIVTAKDLDVPICQDTGMAVIFAEIGKDVHIIGDRIEDAINKGVREAYLEGLMRLSIVQDPLYDRKNTNDNTPAIIHISYTNGDNIKLTATPKGFGSENMSTIKMFNPSATEDNIIDFVIVYIVIVTVIGYRMKCCRTYVIINNRVSASS